MRKWRRKNRAHRRKWLRGWYKKNRIKILSRYAKWRENNYERNKATKRKSAAQPECKRRKRKYRVLNMVRLTATELTWRRKNPDKRRAQHMKRRAAKQGAKISDVELKAVRARCKNVCGICDKVIKGKFHYDHITPLAKGGSHSINNLQMAHPLCNVRKRAEVGFKIAA